MNRPATQFSGMDWHERAKTALERKKWTVADLQRATAIPYDRLNKQLRGDVKNPRGDDQKLIADALGVRLLWLRDGLEPMTEGPKDAAPLPPEPLPPGETMTEAPMLSRHDMPLDVPVYGTAVGGSMGDFQLNGQVVDYIRRPPSLTRARNAFAIFYANDSMFPRYETGDPIYVNPSRPPGPGDDVLIEMHGEGDGEPGAAYVKRLVKRSASFVMLQQFNPPRSDIKIDLAKIRNLWRIVPPKELLAV